MTPLMSPDAQLIFSGWLEDETPLLALFEAADGFCGTTAAFVTGLHPDGALTLGRGDVQAQLTIQIRSAKFTWAGALPEVQALLPRHQSPERIKQAIRVKGNGWRVVLIEHHPVSEPIGQDASQGAV